MAKIDDVLRGVSGGRVRPRTAAPPVRRLLRASDFTYLGYYTATNDLGGGLTFAGGLAHRYVGGELRFMAFGYATGIGTNPLYEFRLNPAGFGSTLTSAQRAGSWSEIFDPALSGPNIGGGDHFGIHWDEGKGGLWVSTARDYPTDGSGEGTDTGIYRTSAVTFRELNGDGTIANFKGYYGFEGVGNRAVQGKVLPVPESMRQYVNDHPYVYGPGGYSSRMAQGYGASLGLMLVAGPDVTTYASPTAAVPADDFDVVADHRSGAASATDWYTSPGTPASLDRGASQVPVKNYFDGGDPRSNPRAVTAVVNTSGTAVTWVSGGTFLNWWAGYDATVGGEVQNYQPQVVINGVNYGVASYNSTTSLTLDSTAGTQSGVTLTGPDPEPPFDPPDSAQWKSPAPDGLRRWSWGDTYESSAVWVDLPYLYGFVAVASLGADKMYYRGSALFFKDRAVEIHVYDPSDFASVVAGSKNSWNVQPAAYKDISGNIKPIGFGAVNGFARLVRGATFDETTGILWLWCPQVNGGYNCALVAYQVGG